MAHVLFVSNKCKYCDELLSMMKNMAELKIELSVVDVHKMNQIPEFIDRVPMLLINNEKIVHDEDLFTFIKDNEKKVEPFMTNEMNGLSDKYSFMDETEVDHVYSFLDRTENSIITTTKGIDEAESKKILNYDEFIENRDSEISGILKRQDPATRVS
jgi:glutaredoxin